jgi:N-acetyl-alpha-D-glucosaminyl L-malate synthase BshA
LFKFPPYALTLASKMADVARANELDILHVHYAIPHATCAYLAKQMMAASNDTKLPKIITTLHGTDITLVGSDPSFYDITRFSIDASDGVTAVSHYLADETAEVFKPEKNIRVIHNFIDEKRFKPGMCDCSRHELAEPGEMIIVHISNFRPVKRTLDVIDIFHRISEQMPAKLILIGEGPDTVLARRNANKRGLNGRVLFLGNQNRVEAILPCCDLMLIPSEEESFGLAALEALACGVPVIGSSGTGLTEVIDDYRNGFLFPVGDTAAMSNAAISLLKDKDRLAEFKKAASELSIKKFASDRIVSEYERYYEEVLHGNAPEA